MGFIFPDFVEFNDISFFKELNFSHYHENYLFLTLDLKGFRKVEKKSGSTLNWRNR